MSTTKQIELSGRAIEMLRSIALQATQIANRGTVPADGWIEDTTPEDIGDELAQIDQQLADMLGEEL